MGTAWLPLQTVLEVAGFADVSALQGAVDSVCRAHPRLLRGFGHDSLGRLIRVEQRAATPRLRLVDLRDHPPGEREAAALRLAEHERREDFPPGAPPLIRLLLIRTGERDRRLVVTSHRLLLDDWSHAALVRAVLAAFGRGSELGDVVCAAKWSCGLDGWDGEYSGTVPPEPDLRSEDFADCEFDLAAACGVQNPVRLRRELPRDTTARIERFAAGAELHTDTVVHGAWAYALARLTGRQSVAFGGAVTGSRVGSPDDQGAISRIRGFRLVTARVEPARSSADLLYAIQRRTVDLAPSASFDTIAALVPEPVRPCTPRLGIRVSTLRTFDAKPYPLSFSMESGPCWTARLDYQAAALSDRVAQAVLDDAVAFLGAIAAEPGRSLGALGRIGNRLDAGPRRARAA